MWAKVDQPFEVNYEIPCHACGEPTRGRARIQMGHGDVVGVDRHTDMATVVCRGCVGAYEVLCALSGRAYLSRPSLKWVLGV